MNFLTYDVEFKHDKFLSTSQHTKERMKTVWWDLPERLRVCIAINKWMNIWSYLDFVNIADCMIKLHWLTAWIWTRRRLCSTEGTLVTRVNCMALQWLCRSQRLASRQMRRFVDGWTTDPRCLENTWVMNLAVYLRNNFFKPHSAFYMY